MLIFEASCQVVQELSTRFKLGDRVTLTERKFILPLYQFHCPQTRKADGGKWLRTATSETPLSSTPRQRRKPVTKRIQSALTW